jgi:hypothetical protein
MAAAVTEASLIMSPSEGEVRTLLEAIDELLSRAKYLEEKHANTPMTPDYWIRLRAVCGQARRVCPEPLKNVTPDESKKTWAEALLCLEAINEAFQKPNNATRSLKKRRSERIVLSVPVVVHRSPKDGPQFYESTHTLVVSAHGALLGLTNMVAPKQKLFVQNTDSGEQQECLVVYVEKELTGPFRVAVEFTRPVPSFWRIAFPPADWNPNA